MKNILCFSILLLVIAISATAQSNNEKEVSAAVEKLNNAILKAEKSTLEELIMEELSYGHSGGKVESKTQFIERIATGSVDFLNIDISDQTIKMAGKSAIVRHIMATKLVDDGNPLDIKIGILMVWQKQKGKWKLLARQGFKL